MRKISAAFLCLALLFLCMPGMARAEATPKMAFENYYLNSLDRSVQLQKQLQDALQTGTVTLGLQADLKQASVDLANGTKFSNIPGQASLDFAFNLADMKGLCNFSGQLLDKEVQGQVFISKDGLIVPRETIKSLAAVGMDFSSLGDLDALPAYVVYSTGMSQSEWTELSQTIRQGFALQPVQMSNIKSLVKELLEIIPDSCYSYSGSYAVLDLTKLSLSSDDFLNNLKSHSESLTDELLELAKSNPTLKDNPDFQAGLAQTRSQIISGINNLTSAEMAEFAEEIPFSLSQFQIWASSDNFKTFFDMNGDFDGNSLRFALQSEDKIQNDVINSAGTIDMSVHTSDFNLDLHLGIGGNTYASKATGKFSLSGQVQSGQDKVSGQVDADLVSDWSGNSPVTIPAITQENSKRVQPANDDQTIKIYLDGREISISGPPPMILNGRTMLPAGDVVRAVGCDISWQPPDTIVLTNNSKDNMIMHINSTSYQVGDQVFSMDSPPVIRFDRTYVPISVVAQYYGLSVDWDDVNQIVHLQHN